MFRFVGPFVLGALLSAAGLPGALPADDAPASSEAAARQAREEAEAGSRAFAAGEFLPAAESFGRAVGLDPSRTGYAVLRARALAELVDRNDASAGNGARLRTVVSIYENLLATDPANEEYAQAVASLLAKSGDTAGLEAWLLGRARNRALAPQIRSDALRASAENALGEAARSREEGRTDSAATHAARARARLDEAIVLSPGVPAYHALRLHGLELELALAGEAGDVSRRDALTSLLARSRRSADAVERASRKPEKTDEY